MNLLLQVLPPAKKKKKFTDKLHGEIRSRFALEHKSTVSGLGRQKWGAY